MKSNYVGNMRKDVVDAIREGYQVSEISDLLGIQRQTLYNVLSDLVKAGALVRLERGAYKIPDHSTEAPATNGNSPAKLNIKHFNGTEPKENTNGNGNGNGSHPTENASRKVALPEYMRGRPAITVFVERSPEEIEGVLRLEIQMNGNWFAIPIQGDIRLCVGNEIPRYSANQETYTGVSAFRVTTRAGEQFDYAHNPQMPLTIDQK